MQCREEHAGEHATIGGDPFGLLAVDVGVRPRRLVRESRSVSGASAQRSAFERGGRPVRNRPCRGGNNMEIGAAIFFTDCSMSPTDLAAALQERGFDSLWVAEHSHISLARSAA